jgi:hypothetical protein
MFKRKKTRKKKKKGFMGYLDDKKEMVCCFVLILLILSIFSFGTMLNGGDGDNGNNTTPTTTPTGPTSTDTEPTHPVDTQFKLKAHLTWDYGIRDSFDFRVKDVATGNYVIDGLWLPEEQLTWYTFPYIFTEGQQLIVELEPIINVPPNYVQWDGVTLGEDLHATVGFTAYATYLAWVEASGTVYNGATINLGFEVV